MCKCKTQIRTLSCFYEKLLGILPDEINMTLSLTSQAKRGQQTRSEASPATFLDMGQIRHFHVCKQSNSKDRYIIDKISPQNIQEKYSSH